MSASFEFLWNAILTLVVAPAAWFLLHLNGKQEKLTTGLSDTREEMAKTYVTKTDLHNDLNRIMQRFDRLEEKIDRITGAR
jgi:Tfp pilus assembly protein PilO